MGEYVSKKKDMRFQSVDSLQSVVNVVNEAAEALNDKRRTIKESAIPEVLTGALGAGIGGIGSFAALYGLGTVGLSAAGIMSRVDLKFPPTAALLQIKFGISFILSILTCRFLRHVFICLLTICFLSPIVSL